ncbi:hypothetical protein BDZ45DRAFT_213627 [Acephala macrosclerotiorum]|nr:hypothetical protein BDZ45DRAFT_213627 [Acephala macrosclerotiorum]
MSSLSHVIAIQHLIVASSSGFVRQHQPRVTRNKSRPDRRAINSFILGLVGVGRRHCRVMDRILIVSSLILGRLLLIAAVILVAGGKSSTALLQTSRPESQVVATSSLVRQQNLICNTPTCCCLKTTFESNQYRRCTIGSYADSSFSARP